MISHVKERYPQCESRFLHVHELKIERDGRVIASMRALGARIRDSWADLDEPHPYAVYTANQELQDLFEGLFGYSPFEFHRDITAYGIRDEVLDTLDVLSGGLRVADKMDPLPNVLYLDNLFVDPDFRGQGLAGQLIQSLKNLSRTYDAVFLEASPFLTDFGDKEEQVRLRAKLRSLYSKHGFSPVSGDHPYMIATFASLSPRPKKALVQPTAQDLSLSI
jgi:GNAT superfamily N-acetyltransferase